MKKFKIVVLMTMLVLAFGIGTVQAAGTVAKATTIANNLFGSATPATTTFANVASAIEVVYVTGVTLPVQSDYVIKIQLTNATFAVAAPASLVTDQAAATGTVVTTIRSAGAIGDTYVEYNGSVISGALAAGASITFVTPTLEGLTAMATAGATVTAAVTIRDTRGSLDDSNVAAKTILTSAVPYAGVFAANATAQTILTAAPDSGWIDVAQQQMYFSNNGTLLNKLVNLGNLKFTDNTTATPFAQDGTTGVIVAAGNTVSVVATGDFSAADSTLANKGIFLATNATCTTGAIAGVVNTAMTTATFTSTGAVFTNGTLIYICMQVKGTVAIAAQAPTATGTMTQFVVAGVVDNPTAVTATGSALLPLRLNGSARYLYNIPSPANGVAGASEATVLIINDSASAGKVYGKLIFNDGTSTATVELTGKAPYASDATLGVGKSQKWTGTQIATALGAAAWPGTKARLIITSETPSLQVQGMITATSNGQTFTTNFSSKAPAAD